MSIERITAEDILGMPADEPERLFSGELNSARAEYRKLAALWHPDRCVHPQATAVFQHIDTLFRAAEDRLARGIWRTAQVLRLTARDGRRFEIGYRKRRAFELGEMFIGRSVVAYLIAAEHEDLYANALRTIQHFKFADERMRGEACRALPSVAGTFESADGFALVLHKQPDQILLRDLLEHQGGRLAPAHTAWILSTVLNLACYLGYAGLTHNAISPDSYFVSAKEHRGALLGGWWYAAASGAQLTALPERSWTLTPRDLLVTQRADPRLDLQLIRHMGLELLGDAVGTSLFRAPQMPRALLDWLRFASAGDPLHDYEQWQQHILPNSFGARRFAQLAVHADDIYP